MWQVIVLTVLVTVAVEVALVLLLSPELKEDHRITALKKLRAFHKKMVDKFTSLYSLSKAELEQVHRETDDIIKGCDDQEIVELRYCLDVYRLVVLKLSREAVAREPRRDPIFRFPL